MNKNQRMWNMEKKLKKIDVDLNEQKNKIEKLESKS